MCLKNLDVTVRLQTEKRDERIREERDYKGLYMAKAAHLVLPIYCPEEMSSRGKRTDCILIET